MALPVKMTKGVGVLEFWSAGKSLIPKLSLISFRITPSLHHSNKLPHEVKTIEAPSGGSTEPLRTRILY
jgi:hypothetical protein